MDPQNTLELLFTIISIFYAFRGLQIAALVFRNWANFRGADFTPQNKNLASRASFFLAVPIGVFFHELSHALAVWLFGGRVVQFAYRVFWGFVQPAGNFTASQLWFIALAGTLASLVFGLVCWLVLKNDKSPTFRYFGLRAFRFQIYFSLIYYPVFTLLGFYGDWRTIYDFNATPILSGATAVVHAGLLLWFWRADRSGFFEMGAFGSAKVKEQIKALEKQAATSPHNTDLQLQLITAYRRGGMENKARQLVGEFLKQNPHSAEGHLQMALIQEARRYVEVPVSAKKHASQALSLGLNKPEAVATAHQIIGHHDLAVNNLDEAIDEFSQAIRFLKTAENQDLMLTVLYFRGQAYRRKKQYDTARQDIQQAITLARNGDNQQALDILNRELQTISHHSGRPPDQFTTPPNP